MSGIPFAAPVDRPSMLDEDSFRGALLRSLAERTGALHEQSSVLSWFTEAKTNHSLEQQRIPLNEVTGWKVTKEHISNDDGKYFTVIGVDIQASNREVAHWTQPMLARSARVCWRSWPSGSVASCTCSCRPAPRRAPST